MKLSRPLISLDVETTGTDPVVDRIISLAMVKLDPDPDRRHEFSWLFNPGFPIPPESTAIHGITDDQVRHCPRFADHAQQIHGLLSTNTDLLGYNLFKLDLPIIWEELHRCGIAWDFSGAHIIDAFEVFRRFEPRDLAAAVKFYCKREHTGAHGAMDDAKATLDVLGGQVALYEQPGAFFTFAFRTVSALAELCAVDSRDGSTKLDFAGTVIRDAKGVARYTHRKVRGVAVAVDPGYAEWMMRNDFSSQTKKVLRALLDEIYAADRRANQPEPELSL